MRRPLVTVAAAALLGSMVLLLPGSGAVRPAHGLSYSKLNKIQRRILSGFATSELNPAATTAAVRLRSAHQATAGTTYLPTDSLGCPDRRGSNVKANRNCLNLADADLAGRSQANNETSVALDPATGDLVMGDNDYRRDDSGCVAAYSRNGGRTWSDSEVPTGFTRGDAFGAAREYWQGAGDPSVADDTRGNFYFSCLQVNRGQPTTILREWSAITSEVASTVMPIRLLMREAAATDADMAALVAASDQARLDRMADHARFLARQGHLRQGVTVEEAADVLWTCSSLELYELLVLRRGWSRPRFAAFLADFMVTALLPPAAAPGAQ